MRHAEGLAAVQSILDRNKETEIDKASGSSAVWK